MHAMKERWLGLSPDGWHNLVLGLLRDRQFEVVLDKIEQMQSDQIKIQPWLYDILMHQLCEVGEHEEAFKILKYRYEEAIQEVNPMMWYYMLDAFSSVFHVRFLSPISSFANRQHSTKARDMYGKHVSKPSKSPLQTEFASQSLMSQPATPTPTLQLLLFKYCPSAAVLSPPSTMKRSSQPTLPPTISKHPFES
jgi:pentatricopeptide repeat protein